MTLQTYMFYSTNAAQHVLQFCDQNIKLMLRVPDFNRSVVKLLYQRRIKKWNASITNIVPVKLVMFI